MRKYVSKKKLRKYISRLESAKTNADIRATSASVVAITIEKENLQLKRLIKGLENQLSIKKSADKTMDEFDKSLKHYEWQEPKKTKGSQFKSDWKIHPNKDKYDKPRWTNEFPNWEN